ncbi:MAG: aldehyde dehydrogenase, partial [Azorhizobium sp. 32-67-21]
MSEPVFSPDDLLARDGTLAVLRPAQHVRGLVPSAPPKEGALDLFLMLDDAGRVLAFNGHVDLGTGIRTALAQIAAEELDVPLDRVTMVLGHTGGTPNQGATIASDSIQVSAVPLRRAAAQARHHLVALAAQALGVPADDLTVTDGVVHLRAGGNAGLSYADLLSGRRDRLVLADSVALKPVSEHRIVGQRVPRVDIPAKATGQFVYVHDVRVPGMLHGRVVRPPALPDLKDVANALRANPARPRLLAAHGDVDAARDGAAQVLDRTYVWPYQMHASIGPSCAVADVRGDGATVWSGTQNPYPLRADISLLLGLPEEAIEIIRHEAAGCYGRNCADDVAADAALLSRAVGRPVRV